MEVLGLSPPIDKIIAVSLFTTKRDYLEVEDYPEGFDEEIWLKSCLLKMAEEACMYYEYDVKGSDEKYLRLSKEIRELTYKNYLQVKKYIPFLILLYSEPKLRVKRDVISVVKYISSSYQASSYRTNALLKYNGIPILIVEIEREISSDDTITEQKKIRIVVSRKVLWNSQTQNYISTTNITAEPIYD